MQTQQSVSFDLGQESPLADLLNRDFRPAQSEIVPEPSTGKRFVAIQEIRGEVEVEREIDFGYSVCSICGLKLCRCTPRIEQRFTQRISYPVEMVVATVITLV